MEYIPNWFTVRDMGSNVWAIDDAGHDTMYLVLGKTKALLVDTGFGIGDLQGLVASLTPLPVIVVNTHGHPDHVGGNYQFEAVHIVRADIPMLHGCFGQQSRHWILKNLLGDTPLPKAFQEFWLTRKPQTIIPISAGHTFDLGERTIRVIEIPGHTRGCIALLDENEKLLFTGDSIMAGTAWLHLQESTPLNKFLESMNRLKTWMNQFDHIIPAHDIAPLPKITVTELCEGIPGILEGRIKGEFHRTFAGNGLYYKFDHCGIVYRENHLK
jgi:glyoxylase-like metal-dependent hydrolase (beta-lactamase superfamily II)